MLKKKNNLLFCALLSGFSHVRLFVTLCIVARQLPLSMGFSRQEYWSVCHAVLQGIFPTHVSLSLFQNIYLFTCLAYLSTYLP